MYEHTANKPRTSRRRELFWRSTITNTRHSYLCELQLISTYVYQNGLQIDIGVLLTPLTLPVLCTFKLTRVHLPAPHILNPFAVRSFGILKELSLEYTDINDADVIGVLLFCPNLEVLQLVVTNIEVSALAVSLTPSLSWVPGPPVLPHLKELFLCEGKLSLRTMQNLLVLVEERGWSRNNATMLSTDILTKLDVTLSPNGEGMMDNDTPSDLIHEFLDIAEQGLILVFEQWYVYIKNSER